MQLKKCPTMNSERLHADMFLRFILHIQSTLGSLGASARMSFMVTEQVKRTEKLLSYASGPA